MKGFTNEGIWQRRDLLMEGFDNDMVYNIIQRTYKYIYVDIYKSSDLIYWLNMNVFTQKLSTKVFLFTCNHPCSPTNHICKKLCSPVHKSLNLWSSGIHSTMLFQHWYNKSMCLPVKVSIFLKNHVVSVLITKVCVHPWKYVCIFEQIRGFNSKLIW